MTETLDQNQELSPEYPFGTLLSRVKNKQIIGIGEASHGTHEFYEWRAQLTMQLVKQHDFTAIALEADQSLCGLIHRYVQLADDAPDALEEALTNQPQWPNWMLGNTEIVKFCRELRAHNVQLSPEKRVSIHGLDRYPLWGAIKTTMDYLSNTLQWPPAALNNTLDAPLRGGPMVPPELVDDIATHLANTYGAGSPEAEAYFQAFLRGGDQGMLTRGEHWLEGIQTLSEQHKVVVWAHNTHIGDTSGTLSSFTSTGQLLKEGYGDKAMLIMQVLTGGGTVKASRERGGPAFDIEVSAPPRDSADAIAKEMLGKNACAVFLREQCAALQAAKLGHRAIGVVLREYYTPLGVEYDAIVAHQTTKPVNALLANEQQGRLRR